MASASGTRKEFILRWKNGTLVFKIYSGSIIKPDSNVDAIVSIWDRSKTGGFSEAIIREAGNEVAEEIKAKRPIKNNQNLVTKAGRLSCKYIIHCACPRWENYDSGSKTQCLRDLYETVSRALITACERGVKSIALPPIGSGKIFGIPNIAAAAMYENHPNPGKLYHGLSRQGYLPDNGEGRLILGMRKRAFEYRLIFTVGFSRTSGRDNVVTWNDIHHKTRRDGGPEKYGYPDPEYLSEIRDELNAKGISEE